MKDAADEIANLSLRIPKTGHKLLKAEAQKRFQTLSNFQRLALLKGLEALDVEIDKKDLFLS